MELRKANEILQENIRRKRKKKGEIKYGISSIN